MAFLELNGWDVGITFSASHFIPGHAKCGRLHGHVYGIRMRVEGEIGEGHMIMDFIEIKRWL
ncbi:MAG: 6-carboxytetrahydropterin synthase, partial [Candidatus Thermoplasmatota archaeon]|nr:6-carboxytetrahydropterin synthase [Candidatus Thermoplasmatota archaeon]